MLKIPTRVSVWISIALAAILMAAIIAGAFFMEPFVNLLLEVRGTPDGQAALTGTEKTLLLVIAYTVLAAVALTDVLLFGLLRKVQKNEIFTVQSVALLRGISWGCVLIGLLFVLLGHYFLLSCIVAFMAVFVGICLRVVKNVIEQATEIKSENDYTI